jgi:hypothetical protein
MDDILPQGGGGRGDTFTKAIVTEVFSNPVDYFSRNVVFDGKEQDFTVLEFETDQVEEPPEGLTKRFSNSTMVPFVTQNSVAVRFQKEFKNVKKNSSTICLPFFPSHLSLPVKPGEYVWIYKTLANEYYWMCRVSGVRQVEDANFTHLPRIKSLSSAHSQTEDISLFYDFAPMNSKSAAPRDIFENIAINSVAYKEEFTGEPVPRMSKKCGDLLLQGSNNAHIQLGKEKFEKASFGSSSVSTTSMTPYFSNADQDQPASTELDSSAVSDSLGDSRQPAQPAIDICVFRKSRELFDLRQIIDSNKAASVAETFEGAAHAGLGSGLSAVPGKRSSDTGLRYFEIEKGRESMSPDLSLDVFSQEFLDSDIYNCVARVYMTNSAFIDSLLFTPSLEGENSSDPQDLLGLGNYGAMVALGANTRVVGAETVKMQNIVGQSGIQMTPQGDVIIHAARSGGAKIVLEAGGNIRISPGERGVVKIGSRTQADEAEMFIPVGGIPDLTPPQLGPEPGFVGISEAIQTTGGGFLTGGLENVPGVPKYASKVILF